MSDRVVTDSDTLTSIILATLRKHTVAKGELEMPGTAHLIDDCLRLIQQWLGILGQQPPPQEIKAWRRSLLSQLATLANAGQHAVIRFTFEPHDRKQGLEDKLRLKLSLRRVDGAALSPQSFERLARTKGLLSLPCLPALCEEYVELVDRLLRALGRSLTENKQQALRQRLDTELNTGFANAAESRLVLRFETNDPESKTDGFTLELGQEPRSIQSAYNVWLEKREGPLFGRHPDAKVMALADREIDHAKTPILDIGAGTGRNSLALARAGFPVDALELTPAFAEILSKDAKAAGLSVNVIQGDILDAELPLPPNRYRLVIASEVVPHFRTPQQLRQLLLNVSKTLQADGFFLFNTFLTVDDYKPSDLVLELAQGIWCYPLTRTQLHAALDGLPYTLLSDESVHDYEQSHLPPDNWPPTPWFAAWATGRNLFPIKQTPPLELRWLLCRKHSDSLDK